MAKRTWVEDYDRCQLALWLGKFDSADQLKRHAFKEFRQQLQLPLSDRLKTFHLETCFAAKRGDLPGLIATLNYSQSYLTAVKKLTRNRNIAKYNGAIALFDNFTDDDISKDAVGVEFMGYLKYNMFADSLVSKKPAYLNDQRVSVWFGTFPAKDKFESYFCLPDHVPPTEDFKFKNPFAEDFKIPYYDSDFAAYNLSRAMKNKTFEDLVSAIPMAPKLLKSMVKAAAEHRLTEGNAVYVAFRLDYDAVNATLKKVPRSRYPFQYLGSFDDPETSNKKR